MFHHPKYRKIFTELRRITTKATEKQELDDEYAQHISEKNTISKFKRDNK